MPPTTDMDDILAGGLAEFLSCKGGRQKLHSPTTDLLVLPYKTGDPAATAVHAHDTQSRLAHEFLPQPMGEKVVHSDDQVGGLALHPGVETILRPPFAAENRRGNAPPSKVLPQKPNRGSPKQIREGAPIFKCAEDDPPKIVRTQELDQPLRRVQVIHDNRVVPPVAGKDGAINQGQLLRTPVDQRTTQNPLHQDRPPNASGSQNPLNLLRPRLRIETKNLQPVSEHPGSLSHRSDHFGMRLLHGARFQYRQPIPASLRPRMPATLRQNRKPRIRPVTKTPSNRLHP